MDEFTAMGPLDAIAGRISQAGEGLSWLKLRALLPPFAQAGSKNSLRTHRLFFSSRHGRAKRLDHGRGWAHRFEGTFEQLARPFDKRLHARR